MEHVYVDTDYDHDFDNTKKYIATQTKRCRFLQIPSLPWIIILKRLRRFTRVEPAVAIIIVADVSHQTCRDKLQCPSLASLYFPKVFC